MAFKLFCVIRYALYYNGSTKKKQVYSKIPEGMTAVWPAGKTCNWGKIVVS